MKTFFYIIRHKDSDGNIDTASVGVIKAVSVKAAEGSLRCLGYIEQNAETGSFEIIEVQRGLHNCTISMTDTTN